jgi:DNA-binding PucR family transcriptional regulator
MGPVVESLHDAHESTASALSGWNALPLAGQPARLLSHVELTAARIINGEPAAAEQVVAALAALKSEVRQTLALYLEQTGSIEACARLQFVHVNTVRYRLRQVAATTGLEPADPDDALTLRLALMLGRKAAVL